MTPPHALKKQQPNQGVPCLETPTAQYEERAPVVKMKNLAGIRASGGRREGIVGEGFLVRFGPPEPTENVEPTGEQVHGVSVSCAHAARR